MITWTQPSAYSQTSLHQVHAIWTGSILCQLLNLAFSSWYPWNWYWKSPNSKLDMYNPQIQHERSYITGKITGLKLKFNFWRMQVKEQPQVLWNSTCFHKKNSAHSLLHICDIDQPIAVQGLLYLPLQSIHKGKTYSCLQIQSLNYLHEYK